MSETKSKEIRQEIMFKYSFTEKELAELGGECGRITATINNLKDEAKSTAADYKGRIEIREGQRNAISMKLANGYEMRPIDALVEFHPDRKTKVFIHPETKEVIREDPMTHADWQLPMFSDEELKKTEKAEPVPEEKPTEEKWTLSDEDKALIEEALKQPKVELDLEHIAESGMSLPLSFQDAAKAAEWQAKLIGGIMRLAQEEEKNGTGAVIEFLKQFVK